MAYKFLKYGSIDPVDPQCRKKIYQSREEAGEMILYIRETRVVKDLHAYRCETCGLWHLTSKPK